MALSTSSIIDRRFALESERGRGGMGTVWKARDLSTKSVVALKLLHDTGGEQLQRFLRESTLLARLTHPAIVAYIAHGTTADGLPYLAMEWLDGENVAERLGREPFSLQQSLALLRSTLSGLGIAHQHGIVHRDLKPSNLFLRRGSVDDVVLLDLGLARQTGDARQLTRSGSVLGTPAYMAPEQAQGKTQITPASDIYALGSLLFECLTGAPPFVGPHIYALLAKVLFEPAPRLREVRPELPEALEALLDGMLAKDPARRIPDASRVLERLDALDCMLDIAAPRGAAAMARPSHLEQELVSVILAAPGADGADANLAFRDSTLLPEHTPDPALPDVSAYGGELKRLADGTVVIVLSQRGSAATDLAARAARCALRLRVSCPDRRYVVATGRGIREQRFCLGDAVDRAGTMLRALADRPRPAIWLDEVTAGLLDARFRVTPQAAGLVVFVLAGEDPSVDAARPLLGRPTTCVGRERELGMLELTLGACLDEMDPRALLVCGPPGIGKSRLRHEFLRSCQRRDQELSVLLGIGDPLRSSGTRSLLGSAIARFLGVTPEAPDEENWAQLVARVARHLSQERELTTTFIAELCGLPAQLPVSAELRAARQNPNIMADRISRACLSLLRAEALARPLLLVLDDLQWSDARTVELVGSALRELRGLPFMVLALGRPETLEVFPDLWSPRLTRMVLHPLARGATRRLIQQVLGDAVGDDTIQRIVAQAGGNALFLEELIRAADARRERVPETVLLMLQARIGLLPATERRVLRTASVLGEVFSLGALRALLAAAEVSTKLETAFDTLCEQEILEQQTDDRSAGRARFRHALMRDAAYALLTPEDLVSVHGLAAGYLEGAGEDPVVVGLHAERGGDPQRAIRQYALAAEQAYLRNDLAAVVSLVARGVSCGAVGVELGVLRSIEAPALSYRHDFAAGWAASQEAVRLLPAGHPKRLQGLAANTFAGIQLGKVMDSQIEELLSTDPDPGALPEYVSALGYAGIAHVALAQRSYALRVVSRLHEIQPSLTQDDAFALGHSYYWQMRFQEMLGEDPHAAWQLAQRALTHNERAGNRRMLAVTLASLGECTRRLFSPKQAEPLLRQAVQLAREVGEPISWSFVQQYLAAFLAEQPSEQALAEADALALEAIELAGDGQAYQGLALIARALAALGRGDLMEAEAHVQEARRLLRSIQLRAYYPHVDIALLRVLLARGQLEAAGAAADESLQLIAEIGPLGVTESALRLWIVRAQLAQGRSSEAARGVEAALLQLERRAIGVSDPALRAAFFRDVPEHAALRQLARALEQPGAET
jgi:tetratricopeptide (TPR) repeat protein